MRISTVIPVLVMLLTDCTLAETSVSLKPAETGQDRYLPYRPAEMTIQNDSDKAVSAVWVRWEGGGPAFLHDVTIAPRTKHTMTVALPAVSSQQKYSVRLLAYGTADSPAPDGHSAAAIAEVDVGIDWPEEYVEPSAAAFIDPALYRRWDSSLPTWPESLLRNVFLAGVLMCLACAGAMFVRSARLRVITILLIAAGGTGVMAFLLSREQVVFEQTIQFPGRERGEGGGAGADARLQTTQPWRPSLLVVSCRRTSEWTRRESALAPVYHNARHMYWDDMSVYWGRSVSARIEPGQVRIFRTLSR